MGGKAFLRELHEFSPIKINCMFVRDMSFRVCATIDIPLTQLRSKAVLKHRTPSADAFTMRLNLAPGVRRFTAAFSTNVKSHPAR